MSGILPQPAGHLIDPGAIEALFGGMDAETQTLLTAAAEADTAEWTERLLAAWGDGDVQAQSRARHSLKGICDNFGMTALLARCEGDLAAAAAARALRDCRDASLAALRAAVAAVQ